MVVPKLAVQIIQWPLEAGSETDLILIAFYVKMPNLKPELSLAGGFASLIFVLTFINQGSEMWDYES